MQKNNSAPEATHNSEEWQHITYNLWAKWRCKPFLSAGAVAGDANVSPWGSPLLPGAFLSSSAKEYFVHPQHDRSAPLKIGRSYERKIKDDDEQELLSSASSRRRGVYGYLCWRADLYEPRLRASSSGGHGEYSLVGSSGGLLSAAEVNKLINEKLPAAITDVILDERVNSIEALALTDIRNDVVTWRQWLLHV